MWTREALKERAKADVKRSYWGLVLMSLVLAIISGGSSGGNGYNNSSNSQDIRDSINGANIDWAFVGSIVAIAMTVFLIALGVGIALSIFVFNPLIIGAHRYFIEATYGDCTVSDMRVLGMGFSKGRYGNIVKTLFLKALYRWLWSLLLIIPGIVKGYEYRMIPYILAENPDVSTEDCFRMSKEMMQGEKWNAFVLDLSFLGWWILTVFTCGILALFYVAPYENMTNTELYEVLKHRATTDYYDKTLGVYGVSGQTGSGTYGNEYQNQYGNPGAYAGGQQNPFGDTTGYDDPYQPYSPNDSESDK